MDLEGLQIHVKITILVVSRGTAGLGRGSLAAACSPNRKHLDRVHHSGYMVKRWFTVHIFDLPQTLMGYSFRSWGRQKCTLVCYPSGISS